MKYCDTLDILVDEQNGFCPNRSCSDHIFTLTSIIRNKIDENCAVYAAFIDFAKAFDWVDRELLLYCLLQNNIDGKMYKSIKALYTSTLSCVRINDMFSGWFFMNSGVRQGDSLSPTLFALFINDLAKEIKRLNTGVNINGRMVSVLLYADDIVLLAEKEQDLQTLLDCTYQWCMKWKLKVNIEKSKIMHFRSSRKRCTPYNFSFGQLELEKVPHYKYLGIFIDEHSTFQHATNVLSESAGRALSAVISKYKQFRNVGYRTYNKMYESAVIPVSDYAAEIWGYKDYPSSNKIQNRAIRFFLGVHKFAPIAAIQGDTGWRLPMYRKKKK